LYDLAAPLQSGLFIRESPTAVRASFSRRAQFSKKLAAGIHAKSLETNLEWVSLTFQVAAVETPADRPRFRPVRRSLRVGFQTGVNFAMNGINYTMVRVSAFHEKNSRPPCEQSAWIGK
jgi:hypothetical protein